MGLSYKRHRAYDSPMITRRGLLTGSAAMAAYASLAEARPVTIPINALFPQTKAIIAAFMTPPAPARIAAINSCVGLLIRGGVWNSLDVLYRTGADAQASSINWKNPGLHSLVQVGTVAFVPDRGFTSDGSTGYLTTNYAPSTAGGAFGQDSAHIGAEITNNPAPGGGQDVTINAADFAQPAAQFTSRSTGNFLRGTINDNTPVNLSGPILNSSGHSGINRIGPMTSDGFKDGALIGAVDTSPSISAAPGNMYICGTPMYGLSTKQIFGAHAGGGLVSQLIANLSAALFSYRHAVGAA